MNVHDYWVDLEHREIWIKGFDMDDIQELDDQETGVDYRMASRVIMNLNILRHTSKEPIIVHLHTCGGSWQEGMAIYDAIRTMPYKTTMISYTHARSMSSIILQAADLRVLMPNSYMMLHNGDWSFSGTFKAGMSNAKFDVRTEDIMIRIYAARAKGAPKFKGIRNIKKYIRDIMNEKEDVYLTAKQADMPKVLGSFSSSFLLIQK